MNHQYQTSTALLALADRTLIIIAARTVLSLLLVAVQLYVFRAALRIIQSMQLSRAKEKLLTAAAFTLFLMVNLPLALFIGEGLVNPRGLLLYAPPEITHITLKAI